MFYHGVMSEMIKSFSYSVYGWLSGHALTLIAVFLVTYIANKISGKIIEKIIRKAIRPSLFVSPEAEKKREDTLIKIVSGIFSVVLWVIVGMTVLSSFGIDIGPLIATAGIAGLALGFGGQYLIRDVISGLFIILENQYRVGDVVCTDGTCGVVENLSLRMTTLRDLDGTVHHMPHGAISKVSNLTKDYARVNLNIGVSYSSDLEKVIEVINKVGEEMARDKEWGNKIIKAPQFLRVEDFADSAVIIKILGDTVPIEQWAVAGELRKRLKIAFDKSGIEIPFPQRVIHEGK